MNVHRFQQLTYCGLLLFLFSLFFFQTPAFSETSETPVETPVDIAKRLQDNYDRMKSLTFQFYQDTRGETVGRARKGSGNAAFIKDGAGSRMRWDYISPSRQVLLSDGKRFSMYFAELNQMIVSPAESLENDLTYSFFSGKGNLLRDFRIHPEDTDFNTESGSDFDVLKLVPITPHSQVQDIHIWVTHDSLIRRIKIRDHFGTITVLNLSTILEDGLQDKSREEIDALFSFTPPEGTEIIEQ